MVWIVVAASAAGCGSPTTSVQTGLRAVDSADPPADAGTATTSSPGPTATPTASSVPTGNVVTSPPPPESPMARCKVYKAKAALDPSGPKSKNPAADPSTGAVPLDDLNGFAAGDGKVRCRIVWERKTAEKEIMITPTCCPTGRMGRPCPSASLQLVPSERAKVETVTLSTDGEVLSSQVSWAESIEEPPRHNCGRRPEGFHDAALQGDGPGGRLAEMAELESASIGAFDRLARELAALGAPARLVDRARAARRDEIRHAKVVRGLARARGASPRSVRGRRAPLRSAVEVALENAVEGCVFETFGAAVATLQAARAEAADVRAAFARIAADERAHAQLAWDVDAFLSDKLDPRERATVAAAKAEARARLRGSSAPGCERSSRALGLPTSEEHDALAGAIAALA